MGKREKGGKKKTLFSAHARASAFLHFAFSDMLAVYHKAATGDKRLAKRNQRFISRAVFRRSGVSVF
jgi:hypothetical protein